MIQFTFENAQMLWFLLALPLLIIAHLFFLRHMKRKALAFANFRALKRVTGKNLITKNYSLLFLRLLALTLLILAVSGATLWYSGKSSNNDYVLAIDTSASMTSQDVVPTRLDAAKADAKLFVDALDSKARIGVVTFAGVSLIKLTPTEDKSTVKDALDSIDFLKTGGTDIPGAIITSTNLLLDNTKGRSIIIITDGSTTIEDFLDDSMQRAVEYALEHHVTIHTIGVGSNMGPIGYLPTYYNVSAVYNEENLFRLANATGGVYSPAKDNAELLAAFQSITENSTEQTLRKDLRPYLMLVALILVFLEWILINTRFRLLP